MPNHYGTDQQAAYASRITPSSPMETTSSPSSRANETSSMIHGAETPSIYSHSGSPDYKAADKPVNIQRNKHSSPSRTEATYGTSPMHIGSDLIETQRLSITPNRAVQRPSISRLHPEHPHTFRRPNPILNRTHDIALPTQRAMSQQIRIRCRRSISQATR
jgi:hypothetical protein